MHKRIAACFSLLAVVPVAGAASAGSSLRLEVVATGLRQPVHVTAAPGETGRLYVTERAGRVRVVENGVVLRRSFLDITSRVRSGGLLGLFSLAFHPRYRTDRRAFAMFSAKDGNVRVVELRVANGRARVARTLLRLPMPRSAYAHVGGQLAFGAGGKLNVGIGDGLDPEAAQDPASLLGKIVRIDVDAAAPAPTVVALGLRNPWRFSFDRLTGDLFIGDVGELGWEEVDVARHGTRGVPNFGWDAYEGRKPFPDALSETPQNPVSPLVATRTGKATARP